MISGRLALGALSLEFGHARSRFDELARRVREMARSHAVLLKEEGEILDALARLYLPDLSPESVAGGLVELKKELDRSLVLQAGHSAELARELQRVDAAVSSAEERARLADEEEERLADALAERRAAVEAALSTDEEYRAAVEEHDAALARQDVLKRRRAGLASIANLERRRYRANAPFDYLWRRGFGTSAYRAGPLARRMDRWLARSIGFDALQRNYVVLEAGPRVVGEEIERLRERAAELERWIDERETLEGRRQGLFDAIEAAARVEKRNVEVRETLARARSRRESLVGELQAVEERRGAAYEAVIDKHREFLKSQPVEELLERARSTADRRDDELIGRLERVRARVADSERELEAARLELERLARTTGQLAEVERTAWARFTEPRSRFPEDFRVGEMIAPMLAGDSGPRDVLDAIAEAHRREPFLVPVLDQLRGWFAELSSEFDSGVRVVVEGQEGEELEADYLVCDASGKVVQRRVTRRRQPGA